jgi:hypothetical protein
VRTINRLWLDARGFTSMELLVALPAALVVLGTALALSGALSGAHTRTAGRAEAVRAQEVALERVTQEIRQASAATVSSPQVLDLVTWVPGATGHQRLRVRYDCSLAGTCRRFTAPLTGGVWAPLAGVQVVEGVVNSNVFSSSSGQVLIRLDVRSAGSAQPVRLEDGASPRNL